MRTIFNMKIIVIRTIAIGVIVIMGIFGLGALPSFRKINEEKRFNMGEINEIQVAMSSESVHIIQRKASNEVKFHYYGKAMQEIKLASEINNNTVVVGAKRSREALRINEDMLLDIYIPEDYGKNLSIRTSSGTVKMDSFDLANFTLDTSSGGLEAEKIAAEKITVNTSSGKLNIGELNAKDLKIKGTAGDVRIDCKAFEDQNIDIKTTSGNVTLELPGTAEFLLEAVTTTGKIQSDFSVSTVGSTDKKKIQGQVGTKSNKVSLQTSTGSIEILKK